MPTASILTRFMLRNWGITKEGGHIILLLDGNEDVQTGSVCKHLTGCQLRELILERHGPDAPSTYHRNNNKVPIDGILATPGIKIMAGGYCDFDEVFFNTDHWTLWIDITFVTAFGHIMPPIAKPATRRLHSRDPRITKNYLSIYENIVIKHTLLDRVKKTGKEGIIPPQKGTHHRVWTIG